jgi:UDP-glucuronate 4-epimerase
MAYYKFTKAILDGTPIETYAGGALQRDFTYIDDIVAGVVASSTARRRPTRKSRTASTTSATTARNRSTPW